MEDRDPIRVKAAVRRLTKNHQGCGAGCDVWTVLDRLRDITNVREGKRLADEYHDALEGGDGYLR